MSDKNHRHRTILNVIRREAIATQEALGNALRSRDILATQSTLSKDMRELGVIKIPDGNGAVRYGTPSAASAIADRMRTEQLLERELSDFVTDLDGAGNTLVVKTLAGHAQGVCEAIDRARWDEVVGTIAGDNTIFVLCRAEDALIVLRARIERMR